MIDKGRPNRKKNQYGENDVRVIEPCRGDIDIFFSIGSRHKFRSLPVRLQELCNDRARRGQDELFPQCHGKWSGSWHLICFVLLGSMQIILVEQGGHFMSEENSTGNNLIWAVTLIIIVRVDRGNTLLQRLLGRDQKAEDRCRCFGSGWAPAR